jgi:hypothetical protein
MITEMDTAGHVMWSNAFKRPITGAQYTALGTPYIKSANEWYFIANTSSPYLVNLFNTDSNGHGICERDNINYSFVDTSIILVTPAVLTLSPVHVYEVYSSTAVGTSPQEYNDGCVYDYIPPPLSVAISSNDASVVLFPNPAFDKMNIKMPVGETIKEVMVNDMSGRQWLHVHPNSNESIDVTVLPSGCYTVMIVTDSQNIRYSKLTIVH